MFDVGATQPVDIIALDVCLGTVRVGTESQSMMKHREAITPATSSRILMPVLCSPENSLFCKVVRQALLRNSF